MRISDWKLVELECAVDDRKSESWSDPRTREDLIGDIRTHREEIIDLCERLAAARGSV